MRIRIFTIFAAIVLLFFTGSCSNRERTGEPIETDQPTLPQSTLATPLAAVTAVEVTSTHQPSRQPTGTSTALPVDVPATPLLDAELVSCPRLVEGETRVVSPGTFIVGPIEVDGMAQFSQQASEGAVAFFEREASVLAPRGAACFQGSIYFLNTLIEDELSNGCRSGCDSVRMVLVRSDEQIDSNCYYAGGSTKNIEDDGPETSCP